ncbi:MAG TPA: hypothetical protein VHH34_12060 [Pseudonocardiaceae bacterium]|nr:hypothetical protein [Pseudonocardiaceae bacterium]
MSFLAALLALAWLAIIVLAFALAGVLRQLHDIRETMRHGRGLPPRHGSGAIAALRSASDTDRSILLVVDDACATCRLIFPEYAAQAREIPGREFRVLTYSEASRAWLEGAGVRVDVDPDTFRQLDLPWRPALVLIDPDGTVLDARPVGSAQSLQRTMDEFCKTATARPARQ